MLEFSSDRPIPLEALLELYASVGWTAYTREPETLERAFTGATYVVGAWEDGRRWSVSAGSSAMMHRYSTCRISWWTPTISDEGSAERS